MPWLEEDKDQVVEGKCQQPAGQQPGRYNLGGRCIVGLGGGCGSGGRVEEHIKTNL